MLLLISQKINLAESVLKTWSEKTTKGCEKSRCVHIPCYSSQEGYVCAQSYATLCNPLNCSPPGFSIHGIFQARILEWVAIAFSEGGSHSLEIQYFIPFIRSLLDQLFNEHSSMAVDSGLVLDIQICTMLSSCP